MALTGQGGSRALVMAIFLIGFTSVLAGPAPGGSVQERPPPPGTWIVQPGDPGPDLPPAGRSLFDHLFIEQSENGPEYRVPFPYRALLQSLRGRLRSGGNGLDGFRQVLIPLGRSLQRTAAAPEFFRYPRVVLAVDGEPAAGSHASGFFLKDRLYLGYVEEPGVLEVISYNESAGRFEFQVVSDYREGGSPRVVYANRAVCTACHQNGTPIFSRPLWGESNADPAVAALLAAEQRAYYGIPTRVGVDIPSAIDDATDRANLIPAVQLLWQQGCGAGSGAGSATACRARALAFALQYRLSGQLAFLQGDDPEWRAFMEVFESNWAQHWPEGLLLSSPDIPNRIPVVRRGQDQIPGQSAISQITGDERLYQQRHIPSSLEPLAPRAPLAKWQVGEAASAFVTGIAGFFAAVDIERLDAQLFALGLAQDAGSRRLQSDCQLTSRQVESHLRVIFRCDEADAGIHLEGRLYLRDGRPLRGVIDRLAVAGSGVASSWQVSGGAVEQTAEGWEIGLRLSKGALHARLPDGNAVGSLRLQWRDGQGIGALVNGFDGARPARMEVVLLQDFMLLKEALSSKVRSGSDALSASPLRRAAVWQELTDALSMPPRDYCCPEVSDLPALTVAERAPVERNLDLTDLPEAAFYRRCALCHRSEERFPPNFLAGTPSEVRAQLAQCAERIYLRLSMWDLPEAERSKTPMPPFHAFAQLGLDLDGWQAHPERAELLAYVRRLLQPQEAAVPLTEGLVARGYERLRPCLARGD